MKLSLDRNVRTQRKQDGFFRGGYTPRSTPLPSYVPFWQKKYSFGMPSIKKWYDPFYLLKNTATGIPKKRLRRRLILDWLKRDCPHSNSRCVQDAFLKAFFFSSPLRLNGVEFLNSMGRLGVFGGQSHRTNGWGESLPGCRAGHHFTPPLWGFNSTGRRQIINILKGETLRFLDIFGLWGMSCPW